MEAILARRSSIIRAESAMAVGNLNRMADIEIIGLAVRMWWRSRSRSVIPVRSGTASAVFARGQMSSSQLMP